MAGEVNWRVRGDLKARLKLREAMMDACGYLRNIRDLMRRGEILLSTYDCQVSLLGCTRISTGLGD